MTDTSTIIFEEIDGKADFYIYRRPQPNPNLNLKLKLSLLWRPELQDIIRKYPFKYEYLRQSKPFVIDKIAAAVPYEQLRQTMSYELFERDYELEMQQINTFRKEVEGKKRAKRRLKHPKRKRRVLPRAGQCCLKHPAECKNMKRCHDHINANVCYRKKEERLKHVVHFSCRRFFCS